MMVTGGQEQLENEVRAPPAPEETRSSLPSHQGGSRKQQGNFSYAVCREQLEDLANTAELDH